MAALAGVKLPDEIGMNISLANNALLFYTEHTLGYSESVREPLSQPTMEQRALKESYAWEATRRTASIGEEAMGLLQSLFNRDVQPDADGKSSIIHLRETDGKNALINLKNGLTGKKLKTIEVDVTGKAVINNSLSLAPLESRFYRIYYTP